MPTIHFLPSDVHVRVSAGTSLLDASGQAGLLIEAACGGHGTCGRCVVQCLSGKLEQGGVGHLDAEQRSEGMVLACSARVGDEDVCISIPEQLDVDATGVKTGHARSGQGRLLPENFELTPLVVRTRLRVPPAQADDGLSDLDRFNLAVRKTCGETPEMPVEVLRTLARTLRASDGAVTVDTCGATGSGHIVQILPGHAAHGPLGVAIDLGTTTVAVQLVDLEKGETIGLSTGYNDQVQCGADVISRINFARKAEGRDELRQRALASINRLIEAVCQGHGPAERLAAASLAGNTTMMHLLLGLDPEFIRVDPYTPTVRALSGLRAADVNLDMAAAAPVHLAPAVGSYVGGDITSGILCTGMSGQADLVELLIDVGTNGEIVVGNRDFLMTCACSAGPAFEGGGVAHGMRAAPGAVERVTVDAATGRPTWTTVDEGAPRGICGTGLIALIAQLFLTGWLEPNGKLCRKTASEWIRVEGRKAVYVLCGAEETDMDGPLEISETDIGSVLRAKAAIYAACSMLLEQLELTFESVSTVYIAGAFGHVLDLEDAVTIGLLPDIDRDRFVYLGNASLEGAGLTLVSAEHRARQTETAERMTNIDLSTTPDYMNQFTAALFLPHTEAAHFPSVKHCEARKPAASPGASAGAESDVKGKEAARAQALEKARRALEGVDLEARCPALGLPAPVDGVVSFRLFGSDVEMDVDTLIIKERASGADVKQEDQTLFLHYLACEVPVGERGGLISFRDLKAGAFYYASFAQRTVEPLVQRFGNDTASLADNLKRFDAEPLDMGDLSARIQAFGPVAATLIYRRGDEEFSASADVLFDEFLKRMFDAEDAAVLAGRICLGLL